MIPWEVLLILPLAFFSFWHSLRVKNREIDEANIRAGKWHKAAIEVNAHWLSMEPNGEWRAKSWRDFARYNPPEVVLELLQLQQEKQDDHQDREAGTGQAAVQARSN